MRGRSQYTKTNNNIRCSVCLIQYSIFKRCILVSRGVSVYFSSSIFMSMYAHACVCYLLLKLHEVIGIIFLLNLTAPSGKVNQMRLVSSPLSNLKFPVVKVRRKLLFTSYRILENILDVTRIEVWKISNPISVSLSLPSLSPFRM